MPISQNLEDTLIVLEMCYRSEIWPAVAESPVKFQTLRQFKLPISLALTLHEIIQ